jgi:hypothetical protein
MAAEIWRRWCGGGQKAASRSAAAKTAAGDRIGVRRQRGARGIMVRRHQAASWRNLARAAAEWHRRAGGISISVAAAS